MGLPLLICPTVYDNFGGVSSVLSDKSDSYSHFGAGVVNKFLGIS